MVKSIRKWIYINIGNIKESTTRNIKTNTIKFLRENCELFFAFLFFLFRHSTQVQ